MKLKLLHYGFLLAALALPAAVPAADAVAATEDSKAQAAELVKKLQNPVASLISVPIQNNWDFGIGPEDAIRYTANVQPVIPFSMSEKWNLRRRQRRRGSIQERKT